MSEQAQDATEASDVTEPAHHEEVRADGERVIVVNSQPRARDESDLPPRQVRSLGSVAAHATDPISGDSQPRRGGSRRGNPLLSILLTAVPLAAAALGITFLEGRTTVLAATAALALVWVLGIAAAWRGLGPRGRDSGGVWLGRAIGLVLGALAAVYLLLETVSPLL